MRKNVSGQIVGAQLVSATDGSAFTGAVTVAVTGDGGTQAAGSVGSGACTHEGNGFHTYAPAQAETNYNHVAFTFTGSGAIPATVQIYTGFPQTGDSFARIGAPAGASVSADIAAIEAQTDDIGAAGAGLTAIPWNAAWDAEVQSEVADALTAYDPPTNAEMEARTLVAASYATAANLATVAGYVDTEVAAIKAKTDNLPSDPADASVVAGLIAAVEAKVDTVDSNVDAVKAKTDSLTFTVTGQVDANALSMNGAEIFGAGTSGDKWRGA